MLPTTSSPPSISRPRLPRAPKNPRRRVRSESDRKKHAGWRHCPRCNRSVSTNGRNFYHHMHKCDRVFFADLIAKVDTARTPVSTPLPPLPRAHSSPITPSLPSPNTLAPSPSPSPSKPSVRLSEMQRAVFLQQLCFLRIYDRTVDTVFRQLEASDTSVFSSAVFDAVRHAKRINVPSYSPPPANNISQPPAFHLPASTPSFMPHTPVPLIPSIQSPTQPQNPPPRTFSTHPSLLYRPPVPMPAIENIPPALSFLPTSSPSPPFSTNHFSAPPPHRPPVSKVVSAMSISSVINM